MNLNSQQTPAAGYATLIAAVAMMAGLLSTDISHLSMWSQATTPGFIAEVVAHIGVVATAYAAGRLIPDDRQGLQTRASDPKVTP